MVLAPLAPLSSLPPLKGLGSLPPLKAPLSLGGGGPLGGLTSTSATFSTRREIRHSKLGIAWHNKPVLILYYTVPPQSKRVRKMPLRRIQAFLNAPAVNTPPTADELVEDLLLRHGKYLKEIKKTQLTKLMDILLSHTVHKPTKPVSSKSGRSIIDGNYDLNKVSLEELAQIKAKMEDDFKARQLKPTDPRFQYDFKVDFGTPSESNDWSDEEESDDESRGPSPTRASLTNNALSTSNNDQSSQQISIQAPATPMVDSVVPDTSISITQASTPTSSTMPFSALKKPTTTASGAILQSVLKSPKSSTFDTDPDADANDPLNDSIGSMTRRSRSNSAPRKVNWSPQIESCQSDNEFEAQVTSASIVTPSLVPSTLQAKSSGSYTNITPPPAPRATIPAEEAKKISLVYDNDDDIAGDQSGKSEDDDFVFEEEFLDDDDPFVVEKTDPLPVPSFLKEESAELKIKLPTRVENDDNQSVLMPYASSITSPALSTSIDAPLTTATPATTTLTIDYEDDFGAGNTDSEDEDDIEKADAVTFSDNDGLDLLGGDDADGF